MKGSRFAPHRCTFPGITLRIASRSLAVHRTSGIIRPNEHRLQATRPHARLVSDDRDAPAIEVSPGHESLRNGGDFALTQDDLARLCERGDQVVSPYELGIVARPQVRVDSFSGRNAASVGGCWMYPGPPAVQDLALALRSSVKAGISGGNEELEARAAAFGRNRIPQPAAATIWQLVWEALTGDFTISVLMAAGLVSLALELTLDADQPNSWVEGAAILLAVFVCVGVSAVNNYQKEQQFRELNAVNQEVVVKAVRSGAVVQLSAYDLLVGDILLVSQAESIPIRIAA